MTYRADGPRTTTGPLAVPATVATALLTQAFVWMFAGLLLTGAVSSLVAGNPALLEAASGAMLPLILVQLGLVVGISWLIGRISATVALGLFFVYAASLGVTIGVIVSLYTGASVASAFLSAAAMFGGAALYGATTKRSLAGWGGALVMLLFGLIGASIVNLFIGSSTISWVLSLGAVVVFTGLTAYDIQAISTGALVAMTGSIEKAAVLGALRLYLDFVNLFLAMLRLFGSRR